MREIRIEDCMYGRDILNIVIDLAHGLPHTNRSLEWRSHHLVILLHDWMYFVEVAHQK